ncbi:MAG: ASCH domain-containing protein [Clostridia bacterium]|nr:ASCH domain-containing protein [Clostridia bacterium]
MKDTKEDMSKTFVMHLSDDMFDAIAAGTKVVETRLFDEKRKLVGVDDYIEFVKESNKSQRVIRRVVERVIGKSFEEVFGIILLRFSPKQLGSPDDSSLNSMVKAMYKYYDRDKELQHGVISFIIDVV